MTQPSRALQQPSGNPTSSPLPLPRMRVRRSDGVDLNTLLHKYWLQMQEGRLYPETIPVGGMERALDIACGAGEWVFDMAKSHPKLQIYGTDVDETALQQAVQQRNAAALRRVQLRQVDVTQPLPIPDRFFDFVHMRRCTRYIAPSQWPAVLGECVRILRPSGWLVIVEMEWGEIASPAMMAVQRAIADARTKHAADVSGEMTGIAFRLYGMLLQAQMDDVTYDLHTVDLGFRGGPMARLLITELLHRASLMRPIVLEQKIMDGTEFDALIEQAALELQAPDLCGWGVLITAYGKRGLS